MKPITRTLLTVICIALLLAAWGPAGASPAAAPGAPTVRWVFISPSVAEIRADGVQNGGAPNTGAISWDIYVRLPDSVGAPYPTITAVPGPVWMALGCGFTTKAVSGLPSLAGGTGNRGFLLVGTCTTGFPASSVTGDDVLLATVTLSGCPESAFTMDLNSGSTVFGAPVSDMFDRSLSPYEFDDGHLVDGQACGPVTPMGNRVYLPLVVR